MHGRKIRSIAAVCAASLVAQPLIAAPPVSPVSPAPPAAHRSVTPSFVEPGEAMNSVSVPTVMPAAMMFPFTLISVTLVPVNGLSPVAIETQRGAIAQIMIELGEDEDQARQMATELTADDLAVLLANPKMMRKAGDLEAILIAVVIVGGIVALALVADSAVIISN